MGKYFSYQRVARTLSVVCLGCWWGLGAAQFGSLGNFMNGGSFSNLSNFGGGMTGGFSSTQGNTPDSLQERDYESERARLTYAHLFEPKFRKTDDSAFNPKREQIYVPYGRSPLGVYGNAVYNYVFDFSWQPGLNLDQSPYRYYKTRLEDIRLYQAERPFSALTYVAGSKEQQMLAASYTQNFLPNLNVFFDFNFVNTPGFFKNQRANNSNLDLGLHYHTLNGQYDLVTVFLKNGVVSNENGGVADDAYIHTTTEPAYLSDRSTVPVRLGDLVGYSLNPFDLSLSKGRQEEGTLFFMQNTFNLGQRKDFLGPDSVRVSVFVPRLRFYHTMKYETLRFSFIDASPRSETNFYNTYPNIPAELWQADTLRMTDKWSVWSNTLGFRLFPKYNQPQWYWQGELGHEWARDSVLFNRSVTVKSLQNLLVRGVLSTEIRATKTLLQAYGVYYWFGYNVNDFKLGAEIKQNLSKNFGWLRAKAELVRATPSRFNRVLSAFNTYRMPQDRFTPLLYAYMGLRWEMPRYNFFVHLHYYRIKNYVYATEAPLSRQFSDAIDVPQLEIGKLFTFWRRFHIFSRTTLQPPFAFFGAQKADKVLQLPLLYTSARMYYENYFKKMFLVAAGVEINYHTPFAAPAYTPLYAAYVYQNGFILSNLPQINLFIKSRINRRVTLSWRLENLNTITFVNGALYYANNNFTVLHHPFSELSFQFAIVWDLVN